MTKQLTVSGSEVGQGVVASLTGHDVLHDVAVVGEWCNAESFHDNIRQVVRIKLQGKESHKKINPSITRTNGVTRTCQ